MYETGALTMALHKGMTFQVETTTVVMPSPNSTDPNLFLIGTTHGTRQQWHQVGEVKTGTGD
jgi:hypothetical protein